MDDHLARNFSPPVTEASAPAPGFRELYRWFAPWFCGACLVAVALYGLLSARSGSGAGMTAAGLATSAVAVAALFFGLKNYWDGASVGLCAPMLVEGQIALVIVVILMTGLAVAGLLLAADAVDGVWRYIGYALFVASLLVIAANLKHYFDARDAAADGGL